MSRIGKKTILIPDNVEININGREIKVKGPKGELSYIIRPEIEVKIEGKEINVLPKKETKKTNAFWGMTRSLIFNMIEGVINGFEKKLEIIGVGYKAVVKGKELVINAGYSHPVNITAPEQIEFLVEKNIITVKGIDKTLVGQVAQNIRKVRKPEPYKGKGIRYLGEEVRRKEGKKAVGSGA